MIHSKLGLATSSLRTATDRMGIPTASSNNQLAAENEVLRQVIENMPGGIVVYDQDLRLVICNEKQKELLEYPPYLFEFGMPTLEQILRFNANRGEYGSGDIETLVRDRMELAAKREPHAYVRRRPNGRQIEVRGMPLPGGGFVTFYVELEGNRVAAASEERAKALEYENLLVDLQQFIARVNDIIENSSRQKIVAIHYVDVNDFQAVKAKYGESGGSLLISMLRKRLLQTIRGSDLVAHIGDDEFAVLQQGVVRPSDVTRLQHRLIEAAKAPYDIGTVKVSADIAIGVALSPRDGLSAEHLLSRARTSLDRSRSELAS